ncbi:peptidoglycan/LPS O-acetylase OafA/YrhL [Curtobacterium herbarum]|uniref:acyltransferase family protein n=1 Tax=Curtobacterium herbarum TaxID=150122 RepID=UPI0020A00CD3|nr:acyltransferase family protein [Curtobacterium herbarum]MCP1504325.1 peptidoglycan/LPS O-acetylase OafA/YrhL [Curtobacterium herbarum]
MERSTAREQGVLDGFRTDVEGIRGVAVALVVLFHASAVPAGGYVGVDVFFVVSGFLITGVLLREAERRGSISIGAFYARRVRRLVPAAVVVLVSTAAVAGVVWYLPRASAVWVDALASLLSVQNVHLVAEGSDYLRASSAPSPLQHFWSLSVEEQFYAVWPLVLVVAFAAVGRRWEKRAIVVGCAVLLVAVSSAWAVSSADTRPAASYFDPAVRSWELGAGAILAAVPSPSRWLRARSGEAVFAVGSAAVLVSAFVLDGTAAFPWPWALLPVIGTLCMLAAGDRAVLAAPLRSVPLRFLGRISYSLYLWHLPVLVFAASVVGEHPAVAVGAVGAALVLAVLTERFVERPFRRPAPRRRRSPGLRSGLRGAPLRGGPLRGVLGGALVAAVIAGAAGAQYVGPPITRDPAVLAQALGEPVDRPSEASPIAAPDLPELIERGVDEERWPADLAPALDAATASAFVPAILPGGCLNDLDPDSLARPATCTWGDPSAARTAVVVGDSIALSWLPAIVAALGDDWQVRATGFAACSMIATPGQTSVAPDHVSRCAAARNVMQEFVDGAGASLVLTSAAEGSFSATDGDDDARARSWRAAATNAFAALATPGRQLVVIGAPPNGTPVDACATRFNGPSDCVVEIARDARSKDAAERLAVGRVVSDGDAAAHVPVARWFCDEAGRCPPVIDGSLVRIDSAHLSSTMSGRLSEALSAALTPIL